MTFALGVNPQYQHRLPTIADALHMVIPHMWPLEYETNETVTLDHVQRIGNPYIYNFSPLIYPLGQTKIADLNSPFLFAEIVIDASSSETAQFVTELRVSFQNPIFSNILEIF